MEQQALLKNIAENAYNIGFGAKKNFKSYDVLNKLPNLISLATLFIGVFQLTSIYEIQTNVYLKEIVAVVLICVGIIGFYLSLQASKKNSFLKSGEGLIKCFNELRLLYNKVKVLDEEIDFEEYNSKLNQILEEARQYANPDTLLFIHWYTNISFFHESQSKFVVEELKLSFFHKYPVWHWETFICIFIPGLILFGIFM